MPVPERRRLLAWLVALCAGALLLGLGAPPARADPTPWGADGASYGGGLLCRLPGGVRVPMARWEVDGRDAFATADVVGTAAGDGPAPVGGAFAPMVPGQDGLDAHAIAALAYLIAAHGTASRVGTAEVSAAVAAAFGGGGDQAACLGQQGTSVAEEAALRGAADRYAGPYRLSATAPPAAPPGTAVPLPITVRSATGVAVPGVTVTAAAAGQSVRATTSAQGVATVRLTVPAVASTAVTVTAVQHTGLLLTPGTPGAVVLAPATTAAASTTIAADLHPRPVLHVDVGGGLLAEHSAVRPVARITGTYGFAGTGTLTLAGPARPGAGGSCSALPASAFAAAPNAWTQAFAFTGDGPVPVGSSPGLAAGCYVAGGSITVTGVDPVARAAAPFERGAIVDVARLVVHRSAVPVLALPGSVATTVTVDGADDATISSAVAVYGPVAPRAGRCTGVSWPRAPVAGAAGAAGVAGPAAHEPDGGDARSVVLHTPRLTALGCYTVRAGTTIERDGRTLTVRPAAGAAGTVVLVLRPSFTLADDTYDTTQGTPMSGHVMVAGTYRYPATLIVRLRSAPPRFDGCRGVSFAAGAVGPAAYARTTGDGTFSFRTPGPTANACYAVEATLRMVDAAQVRVAGPDPSRSTIFLAGRPDDAAPGPDVLHHDGSALRTGLTLLGSVLGVLAVAGAVVLRTALRRRPDPDGAGEIWPWPAL